MLSERKSVLMFANYNDKSLCFLRSSLPLTPPSAPLSPWEGGSGGEGVCHYVQQSSVSVWRENPASSLPRPLAKESCRFHARVRTACRAFGPPTCTALYEGGSHRAAVGCNQRSTRRYAKPSGAVNSTVESSFILETSERTRSHAEFPSQERPQDSERYCADSLEG
jgi:hypothetical protein